VPAPLDDAAFRAALGRFPSGVTVLSTRHEGVDHAITASAFTSVSLAPPRVLACVDTRTRFHDPLLATGTWGVSILSESGQDAASWLATRGREIAHQLDPFPHHRGTLTGAALIDDALGWLECHTWRTYDGGDHTIVVGTVVAAAVVGGPDDPLLYYRSHYGSLLRRPVSERGPDPGPAEPERPVLEPGTGTGGA
jgi:flavin reductase (DIM6/NTAB) family NADH-FMN oxidoreductase RutF